MVGPSRSEVSSGHAASIAIFALPKPGFKPRGISVTATRMASDMQQLEADLLARIAAAPDLQVLEAERVAALGKQGAVTALLKSLGGMTPDERQVEGPRIHGLREAVTEAIAARKA